VTPHASARRNVRLSTLSVLIAVIVLLGWSVPGSHSPGVLADRVRDAGAVGLIIFIGAAVLADVALVPGSWATMAAGFAYGPAKGLLVGCVVGVCAATITFLLGRTLLRDWARTKLSRIPRADALNRALADNSFKLVLLLRLSPLIPFSPLNYALGLSEVRLGSYVLASSLGMLPATWLYAYLGSLATTAAGLSEPANHAAGERMAITIVGFAATVLAVVVLARASRRALDHALEARG
jgi:uncharacterized membrane protein YdjX (TVP38/TMEM64 family)